MADAPLVRARWHSDVQEEVTVASVGLWCAFAAGPERSAVLSAFRDFERVFFGELMRATTCG